MISLTKVATVPSHRPLRSPRAALKSIAALLLGGLLATQAQAFGAAGHSAIGEVALDLIKGSHAETEVRRILGATAMRDAAVWADCVKSIDPANDFKYANAGRYPECAVLESDPAELVRMGDYVRRNDMDCKPKPGEESCHKQYHYTNPPLQSGRYVAGAPGTGPQDLVLGIDAAVAVLKGGASPAPFRFGNEREALLVLLHLLGDLHQPLHVGSIYLDGEGKVVDPGTGAIDPATHTVGGNAITLMPTGNLHAFWDNAPSRLSAAELLALNDEARALPASPGTPADWAVAWASDTVRVTAQVFEGMTFSPRAQTLRGSRWIATLPADYDARSLALTRAQLAKGGARLAQLLQAIWP
nr:S1/P1 nuclease [uncultured Roseateles sp.]